MASLVALKFTKAQLEGIPKDDLLFYFMAGQVMNDINILSKFISAASNEIKLAGGEVAKRSAAMAQLILLLKLTAGRLYEAHKLINQGFSAKGLLKKYEGELSDFTMELIKDVNRYFGKKSVIQRIRKKFAFHINAQLFEVEYNSLPDNFVSIEYLSDRFIGHNLFHMSETLTIGGLIGEHKDNWQEQLHVIVGDILTMCQKMGQFLNGFVELFLKKYFGTEREGVSRSVIYVSDDPPIDEVRLPYFSEPPRGYCP